MLFRSTRLEQGWVNEISNSPEDAFKLAYEKMAEKEPCAIAFNGNIVDLLEYAVNENIHIDLLSDQTSCHAVYDGGYCPQRITFEERTKLLNNNPQKFAHLVDETLRKHFADLHS